MDELLTTLNAMSVEDLECVISKAQKLIERKRQEVIRQAELEKERLEQERIEAERQKQEEITRLQQRLKELQGDSKEDVQAETPEKEISSKSEETTANRDPKEQGYRMIACPQCHKLIPADSHFCFYCGVDATQKRESGSDKISSEKQEESATVCPDCHTSISPDSQFCPNCGRALTSAEQNTQPQQNAPRKISVYMGDAVKKWDMLAGESEILGWKEVNISEPEKKPFAHMKITNLRILISVEGRFQRGMRTGNGLLVYAVTAGMEKGKPWIMIPLECILSYQLCDKKELQIKADKIYRFRSSKAKDIYAALQQILPQKAV